MKKKLLTVLAVVLLLAGMAGVSSAALITIGTVTYSGSDYNLIYDADSPFGPITWLDYTNGPGTWGSQMAWAAGMNETGVITYNLNPGYQMDFGAWRLPSTVDGDYEFGFDGTTTAGFNITSSEMGHLYYEELGNPAFAGLSNTGDFNNLHEYFYWSGTQHQGDSGENLESAWDLSFDIGCQGCANIGRDNDHYAIAVCPVEASAPVPEPCTLLLLGSGLAGLVSLRRRRQGKRI